MGIISGSIKKQLNRVSQNFHFLLMVIQRIFILSMDEA